MRFVALYLALVATYVVAEVTEEENVLVLTESNFQSVIDENEYVLVEFYAPWCGHCKALAPEYANAATSLKDKGSAIKLGKVDATVHSSLAENYAVRGYPTLKFFKKGEAMDYGGGRTAEEIENWLAKKTGPPAITLKTAAEATDFIATKDVTIIGFFTDVESPAAKQFLATADSMDDHPFAITSEEAVTKEHSAKDGQVILFKNFDEKKNVFEGEISKEALTKFIAGNSLPLVVDFNQESSTKIFNGEIKSHLLIFLSKEEGHYDKYLEVAKPIAKKYKGELLFVTINIDEEDHLRILEFFGMNKEEIPGMRIIKLEEDMAKYKPENQEISEANLDDTVGKFLAGTLKQHLLSQDLPEDWDKNPVKVLVSSNFDEIAFNKEKDVLVEFYAPWCGHCKQLAPIYEELAKHLEDRDDIVIAKMDSTVNELEHTKIQSFPTLKLYKKETNEVVDYNGARTLKDLTDFMEGKDAEPEGEDEADETGDVPSKDEL